MATKPRGTAELTFYRQYPPPVNIGDTQRVATIKIDANGHNRISLKKRIMQEVKAHGYTPLGRWQKSRSSDAYSETHTRQLDKGRQVTLSFWHK